MTKINWEDAKPGAVAVLRCGGRVEILKYEYDVTETSYKHTIFLPGSSDISYLDDGSYLTEEHPFDIIEIIPAAPELVVGKAYKWKNSIEKLIYKERKGNWYYFENEEGALNWFGHGEIHEFSEWQEPEEIKLYVPVFEKDNGELYTEGLFTVDEILPNSHGDAVAFCHIGTVKRGENLHLLKGEKE